MKAFITKNLKKIKYFLKKFRKNFLPGRKAIFGASLGIFGIFFLTIIGTNLIYLKYLGFWVILGMTISLIVVSFIMAVLSQLLIRLIGRIPFWLGVALLSGIPVLMWHFHINLSGTLLILSYLALFGSLIGGAVWLYFLKWHHTGRLKKSLIIISFVAGIAGLMAGLFWLLNPGKDLEYPESAAYAAESLPPALKMDNPAEPGPYKVMTLTYGSGIDRRRKEFGENADLLTESVDGSVFLDSWKGFNGKMRTRYFGFGKDSLPLNARVWYPDGKGPFPLVLIVHGNHLAQHFSDPGYEYLGNLLASRGYIFASVDQNFLNGSFTNFFKGLSNENNVRGWLMLKHIEVWKKWDEDPGNTFHNKVDLDNIALIGHSRGGEAVAHAALFNKLPYYPDNARETFDFHFNIRSVVAIAPADGQYQPAKIRTPLTDVNYFVIQGSHDADVSSYMGIRQFNRVSFSGDFDGFKSGLYVYRANHGQFNSNWGRKDYSSPRINFFNLKQLLPEKDQQQIAMVYISAFLDATLKGTTEYQPMFMDHRLARNWLPQTIYLNQYQQAGTIFIANFQEDLDLSTASLPGSHIMGHDLSVWREQSISLQWGDYDSRGVIMGWNTKDQDSIFPCFSIHWPAGSVITNENSILIFDLADTGEKADPLPVKENDNAGDDPGMNENAQEHTNNNDQVEKEPVFIDFTLRLKDGNGHILEFPLSSCFPLQPPLKRKFTKLRFLQSASESETIMHKFYFHLYKYKENNPEFDFENITGISFIFENSKPGVVAVNNIGFLP
jgi:pimeloyl-ACP methyl ester carboxylesterase